MCRWEWLLSLYCGLYIYMAFTMRVGMNFLGDDCICSRWLRERLLYGLFACDLVLESPISFSIRAELNLEGN